MLVLTGKKLQSVPSALDRTRIPRAHLSHVPLFGLRNSLLDLHQLMLVLSGTWQHCVPNTVTYASHELQNDY